MNDAPKADRLSGPLLALAGALSVIGLTRLLPAESPAPPAAHAGVVASVGDSTAITISSGNNEDVLALLDQRSGTVLVYRATPRRTLELMQVASINDLFEQARAAGPSNRR